MTDGSNPIDKMGAAARAAQTKAAQEQAAGSQPQTDLSSITSDTVSQQEFLMLLVNQLQNQDPLNPMESEEFAVQLAQFSQLEQLISINKKMDAQGGGGAAGNSVGMMAGFLGHEVLLQDQAVSLEGGSGPNLLLDVPDGAQSGRVDFINENGVVAGSMELDSPESGQQVLQIRGANVPDGTYDVRAVFVGPQGQFQEVDAKVTGTVEGFVMEPEPALLINGEPIALENVVEVYKGNS